MTFEAIRKYCLSFPHATEDVQWKTVLLFRVGGKIFAMLNLDESAVDELAFKCHPEIYADLIERMASSRRRTPDAMAGSPSSVSMR